MTFSDYWRGVLLKHPSIATNATTTMTRENLRKAMESAYMAGHAHCSDTMRRTTEKIPDFFKDLMRGKNG